MQSTKKCVCVNNYNSKQHKNSIGPFPADQQAVLSKDYHLGVRSFSIDSGPIYLTETNNCWFHAASHQESVIKNIHSLTQRKETGKDKIC